MQAFVAGATGLLGTSLIRLLRWEGHAVSALAAPGAEVASSDPAIRFFHGLPDVPGPWLRAAEQADVLFHAMPGDLGVSVIGDRGSSENWPTATFATGTLLGPGDVSGSAAGRWVQEFLRTGNIGPAIGGICVVDARDVAAAMLAAAEIRARGEFVLSGHWVEFTELLAMLEDLTGRKSRPDGRVVVRPGWPAGSARAVNELGVCFRPVEETLRDLIACYLPRRFNNLVA
jgi:nucleoside-diphosphate-sugar epimerase